MLIITYLKIFTNKFIIATKFIISISKVIICLCGNNTISMICVLQILNNVEFTICVIIDSYILGLINFHVKESL